MPPSAAVQTQGMTPKQLTRETADGFDVQDRLQLSTNLVRAVYDSEKFTGEVGEGLDPATAPARRALGDILNAAVESARTQGVY